MNIELIKSQVEVLFNEFTTAINELEETKRQETTLSALQLKMGSKIKDLESRENVYSTNVQQLAQEQKRVEMKMEEIIKRESLLSKLESIKMDNEKVLGEIVKEKEKLKLEQDRLGDTKTELKLLDQRAKELDHRENLLKKEMILDLNRKDQLDERETSLEAEKVRLQGIAEKLSKLQLNKV